MSFTFDHVHLRTPNVARATNFYMTHFLAEMIDGKRADGGAAIRVGGMMILITPLQDGQSVDPGATGGRSLDHFAFNVTNIDEAYTRLKAAGVVFPLEPMTIRPGLRIAFLTAPDDVSIELVQRG